ncbi:MAG: 4-alpha-glucanotransferase [Bacilli bacterium]|nr:4-alpha-glucanotransferase [Bacilli bacterium]
MNKNLGILCAVSSLPANHGIGDFGDSCYKLINWLSKHGYKYWQVLPINPVGPGYSPYMSTCSNAIEYRYISLDYLIKDGYLKNVPSFQKNSISVDYFSVGEFKKKYLYKAYKNFLKDHYEALHKFKVRNPWVAPYATFEVFKWHNDNKQWTYWRKEDRDYYLSHNNPPKHYLDEINFVIFMQYIALKQWKHVLSYAKRKHIKVICDMPFYVGFDGVECWLNRDQFSINQETCELYEVGGVGPDAFSDIGQLWGTPIYNFERMKQDNYKLLTDRIGYLMNLCDILRIDHFRAFDTYYVIPAGEETARNGVWKIGPRDDFFNTLFNKYPNTTLIAEDLGELRPEVLELRDQFNLPGMYIVQFTIFDLNQNSTDRQIVYPGTHDNETLYGWYLSLNEEQLQTIENRINYHNDREHLYDELVKYTLSIPSKMTILPIQDILKLDNQARMNYPGTVGDPNWKWKLKNFSWINKVKYPFKKWEKE